MKASVLRHGHDEEYRDAIAAGFRYGWIARKYDFPVMAVTQPPKPEAPKPKKREDLRQEFCPKCGKMTTARNLGGDWLFCFHQTSSFPMAPKCGMSGQRVGG